MTISRRDPLKIGAAALSGGSWAGTAPIMGPFIAHPGYDPVHFDIITILLLVVGSVTPPAGVLAMDANRIAGISCNASPGMLAPFIAA